MATPKDFINDINIRYKNTDKVFILDSLSGAINRIQKAFPRYGSFLMEFIQNADDAKSKIVRFELLNNNLTVSNNGAPFYDQNVSSICKVGRSSKTAENYIGYLGVGFKSVFLMSDCVEVLSNGFNFRFSKKDWDDPAHTPWQIVPIWVEESNKKGISEEINTVFTLELKDDKALLDELTEEMKPAHLNDRILLFLRSIEKMEIQDYNKNYTRTIVKEKDLGNTIVDYEIYKLTEYENDTLVHEHSWVVFRRDCHVPKDVSEDLMTKEWERESLTQRQVVVAFRLDDAGQLMAEEKGTAHIGVFSFLPLKEIPSGLNFLIQADFLTMPGRGELHRDCLWNQWLAKEIYNLITENCIPSFLSPNSAWRMNFTEVLHAAEGGHELFEKYIKQPLRYYLTNTALVITEDNSLVKPEDTMIMDADLKSLLSAIDIQTLFPTKKIVHPDFKASWEIESLFDTSPAFNASSGPTHSMVQILDLKAKQQDINFFKSFYRLYLLGYKDSSPSSISKLRNYNIFLTDTWELVDSHSVYIKPSDLAIPTNLKGSFKIINQSLTNEADILEFLKELGVTELMQEHVQDLVKKEKLPDIGNNWASFADDEKMRHIRFFKEQCEKGLDTKDLSFLTLKTKAGYWIKPQEILFPKEYNPDHRLESLRDEFLSWIKEGTLNIDVSLLGMPTNFLTDEFIKDCSEQEVRSWTAFLKQVGIDTKLTQEQNEGKKGLTQRISVLVCLHYEQLNRRNATELGESQKLGYDIQSEGRVIEVKGSSDSVPNIFVTANELKAMKNYDNYYVYVVSDSMRHPTLAVVPGENLLGIPDVQMIFQYNKWSVVKSEQIQI